MARISKDPEVRRDEIISQAASLFTKNGYSATSVKDIVDQVGVAKGTFYHYFSSKKDVLDAIVIDYSDQLLTALKKITHDSGLSAPQKWVQAFQLINQWKLARKEEMLEVSRILMREENLLLLTRLERQTRKDLIPDLVQIVEEGIKEGRFDVNSPEDAVEISLSIVSSVRTTIWDALEHPERFNDPAALIWRKMQSIQTAIERLLQAEQGSLPIIDQKTIKAWFQV
jgi:AcrR family transcriptional regulator